MQPIFLLVGLAAAVAMGIGYLGNDIALDGMIQEFGVGEGTLEIPTESADIVARIARSGTVPGFKDIIVECLFSSPNTTIEKGSMIFCKLLDQQAGASTIANVIAEGMITTGTIPPNLTVSIPITFLKFDLANAANNIHDIIIVLKGP